MFDRMEIPLHDSYGSQEYWRARRSMRYNKQLYELASKFRKDFLNSEDAIDNTLRPDDWTMEKVIISNGKRQSTINNYIYEFLYDSREETQSEENISRCTCGGAIF